MNHTSIVIQDLTNFTLEEFEKLASRVVLTIKTHARSISELFLSYFIFLVLIF